MKVYSALYMEDAHLMQLPTATEFSGVTSPSELVEEDSILILHGGVIFPPLYMGSYQIHELWLVKSSLIEMRWRLH